MARSKKAFKKSLFTQLARVAGALSSANRLEILEFLAQCEYSVEDLARLCQLTIANTSQHLQRLRQVGLVTSRKQGTRVFYALNGDAALALLENIRTVAEAHLAEIDALINTYLTAKDNLEPLSREDLLSRAHQDLVTVLDVRPVAEFAAGHLPAAINVQLAELENYLDRLDPRREIVAYCRGPHCVLAFDAVSRLRRHGFKARRLQDGFPEWKRAGLPIATGL